MEHTRVCTICSTINPVGKDRYDRKCLNCGEHSVYTIQEMMDIVNEFNRLKGACTIDELEEFLLD